MAELIFHLMGKFHLRGKWNFRRLLKIVRRMVHDWLVLEGPNLKMKLIFKLFSFLFRLDRFLISYKILRNIIKFDCNRNIRTRTPLTLSKLWISAIWRDGEISRIYLYYLIQSLKFWSKHHKRILIF